MFTEAELDPKIEALEALVALALLLSGTLGVISLAPALVLSSAQRCQELELNGIGAACSECYAKTADYGFISCKRACLLGWCESGCPSSDQTALQNMDANALSTASASVASSLSFAVLEVMVSTLAR